jgi:leucyl aminopeptidase
MAASKGKFVTRGTGGSAVPILPLTEAAFRKWKKAAKPRQRAWAAAQKFAGGEGEILLLPDEKGGLQGVLWGRGKASGKSAGKGSSAAWASWCFARLPAALPAGRYRLDEKLDAATAFNAALEWSLAQYRFARYRKNSSKPRILNLPAGVDATRLEALVEGCTLTRDLVNTPANHMGPGDLEKAARKLARRHGARVRVIKGDALLRQNFPAIHAVGRASAEAPRLIDISWGRKSHPRVTLVGKGVCFDSGGLDLKPPAGMRQMKKDMGGAATVLGLASAVMDCKLPLSLRILIPAVENAVSGNAFRPGDIIATRKGLNVEIGNTDAEGRLVLADALALADEQKPDLLIDFATLTGAARVALGGDLPALFTDDEKLAGALATAGSKMLDPLWRMPLWAPYLEDMKSPIADLNNIGEGGFAGSITAALFLGCFVEKTKSWAHLDLYAWNSKARPGRPQGGEAMGLRSVFAYLEQLPTR